MQDMLRKIIAVDKKAKETVEEAKRKKENVEKTLSVTKKSIDSQYNEIAQQKIETIRKEKLEAAASEANAAAEIFELKKKKTEEIFDKYSQSWAEEIALRAIKD